MKLQHLRVYDDAFNTKKDAEGKGTYTVKGLGETSLLESVKRWLELQVGRGKSEGKWPL